MFELREISYSFLDNLPHRLIGLLAGRELIHYHKYLFQNKFASPKNTNELKASKSLYQTYPIESFLKLMETFTELIRSPGHQGILGIAALRLPLLLKFLLQRKLVLGELGPDIFATIRLVHKPDRIESELVPEDK